MDKIERFRGCMLGLATGDALGTTLEFRRPGTFAPLTDMVGGGPFHLKPGEWTDDTSMALCLAESLIEQNGFDPQDQMRRYLRWYRDGHLSSTGHCFDIGNTTSQALCRFEETGQPFSGPVNPHSAGNGSLMRLAPVPLFYSNHLQNAILYAGESSRTTHGARTAIDACRYFGAMLVGAVNGEEKETLLSDLYPPAAGFWKQDPLDPLIGVVAAGSFKTSQPPEIQGSGYVVKSLEAALWAFFQSESFEEGCLMAVNLGDDADTTGAIYGQIAGAFYGENQIPAGWLDRLTQRDLIISYSERLYSLSR